MDRKLVTDANSLINFFKYYRFDRYGSGEVYKKLRDFLVAKVKCGEIIVIDIVYNEVKPYGEEITAFKEDIKDKVVKTEHLLGKIDGLIGLYYVKESERYYKDNAGRIDQDQIDYELQKYASKWKVGDNEYGPYADLYLILHCKELIEKKEKPILITDESKRPDKKLVHKIPTICDYEKIECRNLPFALFDIYKDELKFKLEVKTGP
jgi:hypothetical protein